MSDPNVKGILVNIFGGIMQCDIIAQGIVEAVKETHLTLPLVVRLEGNNVEIGKKILRESGLPRRLRAAEPLPQPTPVFATHFDVNGAKLSLFTMISTFGTPQDVTAEELRVGSFYPADDDSEAFLRNLAGQPGTPS